MTYKPGLWKAICDVCGFEFYSNELRKRWDGLMVCDKDFECDHPSKYLRAGRGGSAVPWVRSEPEDTFVYVCYLEARQPLADQGEADCAVVNDGLIPASDRDPLWRSVLLMLHGEGTNGTQVFTDSSIYSRTPSTIENNKVKLSTAQYKFGSASIWGSGGAAPEGTTSLGWTVGPEVTGRNWCVEAWVRLDPSFDFFGFFRWGTGNNLLARFYGTGEDSTYRLGFFAGGLETQTSVDAIPANTWTHVAVTCAEDVGGFNKTRIFINGILKSTALCTTTASNLDAFASTSFWIGPRDGVGFRGIWGYLDEYRVTLATRYTTDFTVPTYPFPNTT